MSKEIVKDNVQKTIEAFLSHHAKELSSIRDRFITELAAALRTKEAAQLTNLELTDMDDNITAWLNSEDRLREMSVLYDEWYYPYIAKYFRKE
jgi:hypothetical protein